MKLTETLIELETDEELHQLGIPVGCVRKNMRIRCSYEFIHDMEVKIKTLTAIRTPEFSGQEMQSWQKWNKYLNELNLDDARKRVCILTERYPPYQDHDW